MTRLVILINVMPSRLIILTNVMTNIFTLLAVTQSVDNLFHSFIVLCENECFLMLML